MRHHHEHDTDGDELLEMLAEALRPPSGEPTAAERLAFRRVATGTLAETPGRRLFAPRPWPALLAAAAAVALVLIGATAIVRPTMPDAVRAAAHTIGLPVDSVELVHTRRSMDAVRGALAAGDTVRLEQATDALTRDFAALDTEDRATAAADADRLLADAQAAISDARRSEEHDANHATGPTTTTMTAPTRMGSDSGHVPNGPADDEHRGPMAETTTTSPPPAASPTMAPAVEEAPDHKPRH